METAKKTTVQPTPAVASTTAYRVPRAPTPVDLYLDGNEGAVPPADLVEALRKVAPAILRRYPHKAELEALLADRLGVTPEQVIVTGGGDDALDRICRTFLCPGRELVLPEPSFEMINRYAALAGGTIVSVPWPDGPYPCEDVLAAVTPQTSVIAVVTPNNPTGCCATAADLRQLSRAAPHALLLVDLAYIEFADEDLTPVALGLPNTVIVRTLSKAWGLAGLRVGYAVGPAMIIDWLRAAGGPYTVSGPSLALAQAWLERGEADMATFVQQVRAERESLATQLTQRGAHPAPSQANFLFARFEDAVWVRDALAGLGIAVRHFPDRPALANGLRITCPGNAAQHQRLSDALRITLEPDAILFDLDGVLADEGDAYVETIIRVASEFGLTVARDDVEAVWADHPGTPRLETVMRLLERAGRAPRFDEIFDAFARIFFDDRGPLGWDDHQPALVDADWLKQLSGRYPLAIVTSRFRGEAERLMRVTGFGDAIGALVCVEDSEPKPSPAPLRLAMERLGAARAWMIGDTVSDMRAARAAGVLPVGCVAPRRDPEATAQALLAAGAARVLTHVTQIEELLP